MPPHQPVLSEGEMDYHLVWPPAPSLDATDYHLAGVSDSVG